MEQEQPSFADRTDHENAARGFISTISPCIIRTHVNGRIVWNAEDYDYLDIDADCPSTSTINAKLWRHSQLTSKYGLFHVSEGIYQVCGFDLSNMTIVEGTEGIIVIDPLVFIECAAAATRTGEQMVIDGMHVVFQMTRATAHFISQSVQHGLGEVFGWVVVLFGAQADALLAGHHWPTWGTGQITGILGEQRDLYTYLHDQTVRMMNLGLNGAEIAETLTLLPRLAKAWGITALYLTT
ncbi:beta-lactamase-like protein [Aspergillus crustosus]